VQYVPQQAAAKHGEHRRGYDLVLWIQVDKELRPLRSAQSRPARSRNQTE
jgi:hypothetical protein